MYGCTIMYLLSESHLSIHTFVDEGKISIDLFTCGLGNDFDKLRYIIRDYFDVNVLCKRQEDDRNTICGELGVQRQ